jgi:hypothetical protein
MKPELDKNLAKCRMRNHKPSDGTARLIINTTSPPSPSVYSENCAPKHDTPTP